MANYIDIQTPKDRESGNRVKFTFRPAPGDQYIAVWNRSQGRPDWRSPQTFVRIPAAGPPTLPAQTFADLTYFAEDYVAGPAEMLVQTYGDPSYFAEIYVAGLPQALTQTYADGSYFAEAYVGGAPQAPTQTFADPTYFAGDFVA